MVLPISVKDEVYWSNGARPAHSGTHSPPSPLRERDDSQELHLDAHIIGGGTA